MDGTLCVAGRDLSEAKSLLTAMVSTFNEAEYINTAQSVEYLARAGGECVALSFLLAWAGYRVG
jgi:hypothetical protein